MSKEVSVESDKQDLILNAAQARFDHFGLGKTTMNEIAADIGMSKASLYYYYPDKEHLFLAVIRKEMDEVLRQLNLLHEGTEKASKKLKAFVSIRHEAFRKLVSLAKADEFQLTTLKGSFDAFKKDFFAKEKELVKNIFQQGVKSGEFESCNTRNYADLLVTTMHGLRMGMVHKKKLTEAKEEDYAASEQYQQQLVAVFLKALNKV